MALINDIFVGNSQTKKNGALVIRLNMKSNLWHRPSNEPNSTSWVRRCGVWPLLVCMVAYRRNIQRRFLPNTLTLQSTFKYLEMHSKRHYKMSICSKLQGLYYYFPKNFRCNLTYCKSKNFPDSSLHRIFEYEIFRFPFILRKIAYPGE